MPVGLGAACPKGAFSARAHLMGQIQVFVALLPERCWAPGAQPGVWGAHGHPQTPLCHPRRGGEQGFLEGPFVLRSGWVLGTRGVSRCGCCKDTHSVTGLSIPRDGHGGEVLAPCTGVSIALQSQDLSQEQTPGLCSAWGRFFPGQKHGSHPGGRRARPLSRPRAEPAPAVARLDRKLRPVPALASGPGL